MKDCESLIVIPIYQSKITQIVGIMNGNVLQVMRRDLLKQAIDVIPEGKTHQTE